MRHARVSPESRFCLGCFAVLLPVDSAKPKEKAFSLPLQRALLVKTLLRLCVFIGTGKAKLWRAEIAEAEFTILTRIMDYESGTVKAMRSIVEEWACR